MGKYCGGEKILSPPWFQHCGVERLCHSDASVYSYVEVFCLEKIKSNKFLVIYKLYLVTETVKIANRLKVAFKLVALRVAHMLLSESCNETQSEVECHSHGQTTAVLSDGVVVCPLPPTSPFPCSKLNCLAREIRRYKKLA